MPLLPPPYTARKASPPPPAPGRSQTVKTSSTSRKHRFTLSSLRGNYQPELSKRLFKLIKSENYVINAHESAGHERQSIAAQLSEWGEQTGDDAVSEISDKLGVLLSELGTQEEVFAQNLEDYRTTLKQIRNTESSVQPSRDHKVKLNDEINRLKYKDPTSPKIAVLEQELVRAEAENLVAEAQLTNVTRAKLKEAYANQFAAVIERSEKQAILARHGRRMLNLLNDAPVVPGDSHPPFEDEKAARKILNDAEEEIKEWTLDVDEVTTNAHAVLGGVVDGKAAASHTAPPELSMHPAHRTRTVSGGSTMSASSFRSASGGGPPYPISDGERSEMDRNEKQAVAVI